MKISSKDWLLAGVVVLVGLSLGWVLGAKKHDAGPLAKLQGMSSRANTSKVPTVHFVYFIPSDYSRNDSYFNALNKAASNLQDFYGQQLGLEDGKSFTYVVEHKVSPNPSYYYNESAQWDYYQRTLADGFSLTGGKFNDPNNRWIFVNAAPTGPGQAIGGTSGIAVLDGKDLAGLAGEGDEPNVGRFIGGLGHELGHAFTLPHPPYCPGDETCNNDLMYMGYSIYPNNVRLNAEAKKTLLESPEVRQFFLPEYQDPEEEEEPEEEPWPADPILNLFDLNSDKQLTYDDVEGVQRCQIGLDTCSMQKGDYNKDGQINSVDVIIITRAQKGIMPFGDLNKFDLNFDRKVDEVDIRIEQGCQIGVYSTCSNGRNDFNKDGQINSIDVITITNAEKQLNGGASASNTSTPANMYDLNGDGKVDTADIDIQRNCQNGIGNLESVTVR
jgi:hypothetical protein